MNSTRQQEHPSVPSTHQQRPDMLQPRVPAVLLLPQQHFDDNDYGGKHKPNKETAHGW